MIERFYLKEHLSFKEVALEFDENLIIFTGPSGAGKSILMESLLALFGLKESDAKYLEASIAQHIDFGESGIEADEPNIFKYSKEKSARYFINNQQISKRNLKRISGNFINYLTLREFKEFENENILHLLDAIAGQSGSDHESLLHDFKTAYEALQKAQKTLIAIEEEEKKIAELKEFAAFEIQKIESIDPKPDEYETLLEQKKALSKKEKIENALTTAMEIFQYEGKVNEILSLLEVESSFLMMHSTPSK